MLFNAYIFVKAEECHANNRFPLWIVDGVEMTDSVFRYTLEEMKSDNAAVLAAISLNSIHRLSELKSIDVIDSVAASRLGYPNCSGIIYITTHNKRPITFIINGLLHRSHKKLSSGQLLVRENIDNVIKDELSYLKDYGIKDVKIVDTNPSSLTDLLLPIIFVNTDKPFYDAENMVGNYRGKTGQCHYDLTMNSDLTYVFSKRNKKVETTMSGVWYIENEIIYLIPSKIDSISSRDNILTTNFIRLQIKNIKELILLKDDWGNRKDIKIRRQISKPRND